MKIFESEYKDNLIELEYFSFLLNHSNDIERRQKLSTISRYRCEIYPESFCDNYGYSGRNDHGFHIHIKIDENYIKFDFIKINFYGNINSKDKKRILEIFKEDIVKKEIIEIWNKNRKSKIKLNNNVIQQDE